MKRQSDLRDATVARPEDDEIVAPNLHPDTLIQVLASRQHGVVARWQLKRAGVPPHRIDYHLKKGWLGPIHRGIYRVGPVASPRHREMAALLACGTDATLSHRSAGALWDLLAFPTGTAPVSVSTPHYIRGRSSGVRVHRVTGFGADEITHRDGLQLTTPARTLLDLAGSLETRELERVLARADRKQLLDPEQIRILLARHPRRHGNVRMRALIDSPAGPALTRSEAEERFLTLVRKSGLRPPETNIMVRGFEVDALWRAERLIVEVDGFAFHSSPTAFERDRHRDGVLIAAGFRVMRVTWEQLTGEVESLLVRLAQALVVRDAP